MVKIDIAALEATEHAALAPLPIVIDQSYLYQLQHQASELDVLLARMLKFGKKSELPQVLQRLNDDLPSSLLRIRNLLFIKHARANETLAERAVRSRRFLHAAEHLSDAYRSLEKCDVVPVTYLFTHEGWNHSISHEAKEGGWARHIQERRLAVVRRGLQRPRNSFERTELLRHLFGAAIRLAEHDRVPDSAKVEAIAAYVATAWSPRAERNETVKSAIGELIKAIVYGVAANGLWYLYRMYSTMDPQAMADTYSKIYEEVSNVVSEQLSLGARTALGYGTDSYSALEIACFREFSHGAQH